MLEVYHFVNPLSGDCLETEKKLATYVEQSNKKVAMQIIPVVTMQSARQTAMASSNSLHPSLHDLNVVSQTLYQVAVDTKAAQFQGKKAAREYLMATQQALLQGNAYSDELLTIWHWTRKCLSRIAIATLPCKHSALIKTWQPKWAFVTSLHWWFTTLIVLNMPSEPMIFLMST